MGFEPTVQFDPHTRFPSVRLRPLGHLSIPIIVAYWFTVARENRSRYNQRMDTKLLKTTFYILLIGSLVASAAVGVTSVLIGEFNNTLSRALWSVILVAIHSLLGLMFTAAQPSSIAKQTTHWTRNTTFIFIMVSFLLSVLGLWGLLAGGVIWNSYQAMAVTLFAVFHSEVLATMLKRTAINNAIIYANYVFISIVVTMLVIIIFADEITLGDLFNRLLGAAAIIDGTLTLLAIIFNKMFASQHPVIQIPPAQPVNSQQQGVHQPIQNELPVQTATNPQTKLIIIVIAVLLGLAQFGFGFAWILFT